MTTIPPKVVKEAAEKVAKWPNMTFVISPPFTPWYFKVGGWVVNGLQKMGVSLETIYNIKFGGPKSYQRLGLSYDDAICSSKLHWEAVRRLPLDIQRQRIRRIMRAGDLSMKQQTLPKDQWTTLYTEEQYLQPYLQEVYQEMYDRVWFRY